MAATRTHVRAEPNVTPMIDVMLVLLIIFMVVGPTLADGFDAIPPVARFSSDAPKDPGEVVLGLDADGRMYLDKKPIDSTSLRRELTARYQQKPEHRVLFLWADASLPYEQVQSTMALASSAGAQVIGLVSREPSPASRD
jgi:biopolymer transport protein TolR